MRSHGATELRDSEITIVSVGAEPAPERVTVVGMMAGGYRIVREVGRGAMGTVYLAEHSVLGTPAAVKVLREEYIASGELYRRFIDEARLAAQVRHPHIAQFFDLVPLPDGRPCLVMEYLDAPSLEAAAGAEPMAPARALQILLQLCDAVGEVHHQGIIHRDIKAQNVVLLRQRDGGDFVKLLDFGIARLALVDAGLTAPGTVLGTPHYMAPEQALGAEVHFQTDIYALGVLAYRLFSGQLPFRGTPGEVLLQHVQTSPPEPPGVAPALRQVILRALAKRPDDRYPSVAAFAQALAAALPSAEQPRLVLPMPGAPGGRPAPRFQVHATGERVRLRFASEQDYLEVERTQMARGRLFVPGVTPALAASVQLHLEVPGRGVRSLPAAAVSVFDARDAASLGVPVGFVAELEWPEAPTRPALKPLPPHLQQAPSLPTAPATSSAKRPARVQRYNKRLTTHFGQSDELLHTGFTTDLSATGMGLLSTQVLPAGSRLFLRLALGGAQAARLEGVVVWARAPHAPGAQGVMGIRLTGADESYFQLLVALADTRHPARPSATSGLHPPR